MVDVQKLFSELSLHDLFKCREVLNIVIERALIEDKATTATKDIKEYCHYSPDYVPKSSPLYDTVQADIESFKFKELDLPDNHTASKWLCDLDEPYTWNSSKLGKSYVNKAHKMSEFQGIKELCGKINTDLDTDLNSCLVTFYPNGTSGVRLHADGEEDMDRNSPICVLTLGVERCVEFLYKYQPPQTAPLLSFYPSDGSMYSMNPGCQDSFRHRVKSDKSVIGSRVSLSFRKKLSSVEIQSNANVIHVAQNNCSPVKKLIKQFECSNPASDIFSAPAALSTPPLQQTSTVYHPRPKVYTVLFGTSITMHIKQENLALKKGRKLINLSSRGARMTRVGRHFTSISNIMDKFAYEDSRAYEVEKVVINMGTNDIRFDKGGVKKHEKSAEEVLAKAHALFPGAQVIVICTLPMRNIYTYTVRNFMGINWLLEDLCVKFNCTFVDCFMDFLRDDLWDINRGLYCFDGLHLNRFGIQVLTKWFAYIVNMNFNSVIKELPFRY